MRFVASMEQRVADLESGFVVPLSREPADRRDAAAPCCPRVAPESDLAPGAGNEMLRVSGLAEELSELLGVRVDVVAASLLRDAVSATALHDAVAV